MHIPLIQGLPPWGPDPYFWGIFVKKFFIFLFFSSGIASSKTSYSSVYSDCEDNLKENTRRQKESQDRLGFVRALLSSGEVFCSS